MKKYICKVCGHVYDPANNNNVAFEDLPDDWTCPVCGVGKDQFEEMGFDFRKIINARRKDKG